MIHAVVASLRSTCGRTQVGAVLARDGRIISTGYAGPSKGLPHCSSHTCDVNKPCTRTTHAEANLIAYAARYGIATDGAHLYCTLSPCTVCARSIISAGITRVYYLEAYRDPAGLETLREAGIPCEMISANGVDLAELQLMYVSKDTGT
jgi:dCMP deaminase